MTSGMQRLDLFYEPILGVLQEERPVPVRRWVMLAVPPRSAERVVFVDEGTPSVLTVFRPEQALGELFEDRLLLSSRYDRTREPFKKHEREQIRSIPKAELSVEPDRLKEVLSTVAMGFGEVAALRDAFGPARDETVYFASVETVNRRLTAWISGAEPLSRVISDAIDVLSAFTLRDAPTRDT
jgi:hypothetical protein